MINPDTLKWKKAYKKYGVSLPKEDCICMALRLKGKTYANFYKIPTFEYQDECKIKLASICNKLIKECCMTLSTINIDKIRERELAKYKVK